jgi:hypothetical protein
MVGGIGRDWQASLREINQDLNHGKEVTNMEQMCIATEDVEGEG